MRIPVILIKLLQNVAENCICFAIRWQAEKLWGLRDTARSPFKGGRARERRHGNALTAATGRDRGGVGGRCWQRQDGGGHGGAGRWCGRGPRTGGPVSGRGLLPARRRLPSGMAGAL